MNQNLFAALSCIQFIIIVAGLLAIVFNKPLMAWERKTMRRFRSWERKTMIRFQVWKRRVRRAICAWLMHKDGVVLEPVVVTNPKADAEALMRLLTEET